MQLALNTLDFPREGVQLALNSHLFKCDFDVNIAFGQNLKYNLDDNCAYFRSISQFLDIQNR